MNNMDEMSALFVKLGIRHSIEKLEDGSSYILTLQEGKGYIGFYCSFDFDKDGRFVDYGIWE